MAKIKEITKIQNESLNRKTTGFLIAFLGLIMIVGVSFLARFADLAIFRGQIKAKSDNQKAKIIRINGTPACLPLKASGDDNITIENNSCELGLKSDDGKYYALNKTNDGFDLYGQVGTNSFEVEGEFIKAGDSEPYAIEGTILQ